MNSHCNYQHPWTDGNFTPCFHQRFLDTALPLVTILVSLTVIVLAIIRRQRKLHYGALYTPLNTNSKHATTSTYGATNKVGDQDSDLTAAILSSSSSSSTTDHHWIQPRVGKTWSVCTWIRVTISVAQWLCCLVAVTRLKNGDYTLDSTVEGTDTGAVLWAYGARLAFWAYTSVLVLYTQFYGDNIFIDKMMYHLNGLYMIDLTLRLLDVRSFYLVHDIEIGASMGYGFSVTSLCLALILLVVIINETPYNAPIAPVVSDTGRVMSGEQWASIYSKFMFSWVDAMMKKGWVQTLNDEDLLDLPQENQTHYTLAHYRLNYKWNMGLSIMRTFRVPLLIQSGYSMVWSLAMFGPPFFLNKIIKFIENTQPDHQVSVFTAFLYVLGLFLTSCAQSLAYQQALYIGRTLGIRIQSIVIGEVFSKSLRRRDNTGAASNGNNLSEDGKPKGNVNNLLSVDAQKLGEVASYLFYFYCFPIQVTVCIWGLYKLLGVASLYGVLVMVISQPVTFYMGRLFQQSHQKVMGCTDKRLKLMNELLNSIRIVKFFAWEKEFRHRISAARDVELKAIRSRLYSYMWMGNILFLIPVLIMVTVFYFYTKTFALTASTAFTALALFNTFKSIFDELPAITSFILQGSVSLRRIGNFLEEEEIIESPATLHPTVNIGFVDNASFSWENPNNNDNQQSVTPTLSNLNLSFPLNKLSLICGATGSGKSALIASLLGETHRLSGAVILPRKPRSRHIIGGAASGIAYVAQTAWLQNMSIRDNILFGLPYDAERYNKVLYMTALTRDLDILEYGDSTEVGEKGISLSGGQKQRVAIARAVYSQADIVILDDCLSAVDAHTAKHLYEHCLTGEYMKHRTVILVTHHVGLCIRAASYVVALKDGRVESSGTPVEVINSGALGEEFNLLEDIETGNEAESAEGPIPTVQVNLTNTANQKDGHGKLTKDEERAEGGVKFSVYQAYMKASGGYLFWVLILFLFCLAQGSVVGQDYWIRVWSAAYGNGSQKGDMSTQSVGDHPLLKPSHINVNYYLFIYFLIGMLALLVTTLRSLVLFTGSLRASRHIHSQLLERILNAKVRFFDTTPLGRIVNRFSSDLETLDQAVAPSLTFLLYSIIATAYVVILITIITPSFIIPGVFVAFLFWRIGNYYLRSSRDMKRLNSVSRSPIYVQFNESISGVATIRAFGSESRFIEDNCKKVDNNNRPFIWMWATNRWLHCRVDVLGAFVGFCTGCVLIISRSWVDPGLAGLSLSYALTFTHHILWIVRCYAINEMNCVSIERIQHYLEIEQEASSSALVLQETPRPSWPEAGHVKIENLVMQYSPETPVVLHDLSFETKPREKIGIVGRSGSGKSTLALSVFRIMEATSGRIMIDGVDISTLDLNDLRSRLTIIPQDPTLFSGTLRSNLDPFNQHDDAELWAAIKRSHLADESGDQSSNGNDDVVSLDAVVLENGSNWSQGQRQLIALARALVKKSSLIVLDEATSSVDFETDHKIQQTIRTEFGESTLLCIAHRLRTVLDMDRILVLDAGKLVEFDDPYTLITRENGAFKSMCEKSGEYFELLAMAKAQHDKNLE